MTTLAVGLGAVLAIASQGLAFAGTAREQAP
jgi:hypothetical protein